jgi:hypothetical protein
MMKIVKILPFYLFLFCFCLLIRGENISSNLTLSVSDLNQTNRIIRIGDVIKITLQLPGRTLGSLEPVQKEGGDVATPEGSFLKALGLSLADFRTELNEHYKSIPGYEEAKASALIYSSPYRIIKHFANDKGSHSSTNAPGIYRRCFKQDLTVWQAIQQEGGVPENVDRHKINILKRDLSRKTLDCSGKNGNPDGSLLIESGDYIFLVPEGTSVSKIFD